MSIFSSGLVERVVKVLPQLHLTAQSTYSGWIPCFIVWYSFYRALVSDQGAECGLVSDQALRQACLY